MKEKTKISVISYLRSRFTVKIEMVNDDTLTPFQRTIKAQNQRSRHFTLVILFYGGFSQHTYVLNYINYTKFSI